MTMQDEIKIKVTSQYSHTHKQHPRNSNENHRRYVLFPVTSVQKKSSTIFGMDAKHVENSESDDSVLR